MNPKNNQKGNITLIMVFFVAIVLFLFVFTDHVNALKEKVISKNDASTEQAFYAAQSCLEEGFLQLRTNENYTNTTLTVGGADCTVTAVPDQPGGNSGKLVSEGDFKDKNRTVASVYKDAGASTTRSHSAIFHILDRSGSMADDGNGCTIQGYITQDECEANGGVWGVQPYTSVKEAAKSFIDNLDSSYDRIGAVYYNNNANLSFSLTNDFNFAKQKIDSIPTPNGYTNIGDAISLATTNLAQVPTDQTRVEILLTDGKANCYPIHDVIQCNNNYQTQAEQYAIGKANEAKNNGIIIFTIGLGNDINENFLKQVASYQTMYFHAPNASDLEAIYAQIANIINSYNIKQNTWQEE